MVNLKYPAVVFAANAIALLIPELFVYLALPTDTSYRTVWAYVVLAIFVGGLVYGTVRRRHARLTWEVICAIAAIAGVWYLPSFILPMWAAIVASSLLTLTALFWRPAANVFALMGAVGLAFAFASWLPIEALLAGLAVLVTYDMVAGSHGHGVQSLVDRVGSKAFLPHLDVGTPIGVIEVAIPCAVVLAMLPFGLMPSIIVAAGGTIGALVASIRTPRELRAEYVAIGTIAPAVILLLISAFL
jgi:hypothetical protein